jgi:sensor domain CHASE-containing protein
MEDGFHEDSSVNHLGYRARVASFSRQKIFQNGEKYTKLPQHYQMVIIYNQVVAKYSK